MLFYNFNPREAMFFQTCSTPILLPAQAQPPSSPCSLRGSFFLSWSLGQAGWGLERPGWVDSDYSEYSKLHNAPQKQLVKILDKEAFSDILK